MPGLQQVVIEADVVDAADRRLGVGVGGEEYLARVRVELPHLAQQLRPGHLGHPLVHQEQGDHASGSSPWATNAGARSHGSATS